MEDVTLLFTLGAIPSKICLSHPLGLLAGRRPPPKSVGFDHSVLREPQGRFVTLCFSLGVISINKCSPFRTFRGCWQGESPHLKVFALVIP